MRRLLITGAAGALGRMARARLGGLADTLRLSDLADPAPAGPNEEVMTGDLSDPAFVNDLVAGCDGIVHFGGVSVEDDFSKILGANIIGVKNLYEAARLNGRPRILFASSNHVVGFHPQTAKLDASAEMRPDGWYGVSKGCGELVAKMYWEKAGVETAILRIGSCLPEPGDRRQLSTWLSHDDFVQFAERVFNAPRLGCPVVYGASANAASWWDNRAADHLGWAPKDDAEAYRAKVEAAAPRPAADAPEAVFQGDVFTVDPIYPD